MRTRRPEADALAGPCAMDALEGLDQARFERHLARCPECSWEGTGLRGAAARLATAAATRPRAALRERLLAETAWTRQQRLVTRPVGRQVRLTSR